MSNYAIILAGGIGKRMRADIPKQFIVVNDKPIIVYTLENFQKNNSIKKILIVCVKDWIGYVQELVERYSISKVEWIIEGGETGHDSIRNGVFFLQDKIKETDTIVIHDAVRPILPQKALDEVIRVAHEMGNASSSIACHPPIVYTEDFKSGITDVDRNHVMLTASPQAFNYALALRCYKQAEQENLHNTTFTSSLLIHCGERVYFAEGTTCNIKITKKEDIALFKALLTIPEESLYR